MSFKFNVTTTTTTAGGNSKDVDWDGLNDHVVKAANTEKKSRSIPGIVSGIYDLGEQNRDDAEIDTSDKEFKVKHPDYDGSDSAKKLLVEGRAGSYFKEEGGKEYFCYPQKPVQQVAVAVDFPQILVNKGQFFGNSSPLPLRLLLNGEFSIDGTRVVGKPYNIVEKKYDDGTWAFAKNSGLHKLADACGVLDDNGYFSKDNIGDLLGKAAQFTIRVWMKPSKKDASKKYFTEEIALSGMVPEGITIPEFDESILHGINLMGENDPSAVKQLRYCVKNTIKRANNYEVSDLKKVIDEQEGGDKPAQKPAAKPIVTKPKPQQPEADDDFSEDSPF